MSQRGAQINVLCFSFYPDEAPSVRMRIVNHAGALLENGIRLELVSLLTSQLYRRRRRFGFVNTVYKSVVFLFCTLRLILKLPRAYFADVVIIHREVFPLGPPWVELALSKLSKRAVYDLDDAIWHPPSNAINQRALFWDRNRVGRIVEGVDIAVAGSPYVATYMREHNENVVEVPTTCKNYSNLPAGAKKNRCPVVVWIGNWGNAFYLHDVIGALESCVAKTPFVLRLVGGDDIHSVKSDLLEIEYVEWAKEREEELLRSSDIGIMPLVDSDYERGKCSFKLIQYMSAGLPVIASPVGMNKNVVTGDVGFLAETEQDWSLALEALLGDPELRAKLSISGHEKYCREFSPDIVVGRLTTILRGE